MPRVWRRVSPAVHAAIARHLRLGGVRLWQRIFHETWDTAVPSVPCTVLVPFDVTQSPKERLRTSPQRQTRYPHSVVAVPVPYSEHSHAAGSRQELAHLRGLEQQSWRPRVLLQRAALKRRHCGMHRLRWQVPGRLRQQLQGWCRLAARTAYTTAVHDP